MGKNNDNILCITTLILIIYVGVGLYADKRMENSDFDSHPGEIETSYVCICSKFNTLKGWLYHSYDIICTLPFRLFVCTIHSSVFSMHTHPPSLCTLYSIYRLKVYTFMYM